MQYYKIFTGFLICGLLFTHEVFAQRAAQQKIRGLATQQVLTFCSDCEVSVESKWIPDQIKKMNSGRIKHIQFDEVGMPRGYQTANVAFFEHGKSRSRQVQLLVTVKQKLPVVNKRIERNRPINVGDLSWKILDITRMRKFPIASVKDIAGKSAHRMIAKGSVVLKSDLQQVPVIEVGDQVQMVYRDAGIEVALQCTARQAKGTGEQIHVYSQETGKIYNAKVETPSKVIWNKTL